MSSSPAVSTEEPSTAPLTPDQREALARAMVPAVLALVRHHRRRDHSLDGDELLSDGLLAVTLALDSWQADGTAPFRLYALKAAGNAMAEVVRRTCGRDGPHGHRARPRAVGGMLLGSLPAPEYDPIEELEPEQQDEALPAWTQCLSEDEWELIRCLEEGEGHKARARRLGISRDRARGMVQALRDKVGRVLEGGDEGEGE